MSKQHALLRSIRLFHLYIGVFIAPAILFFAFTGALQTFSLHETTPGSTYQPPRWAMVLAQIHKKATPIVPPKKLAPPVASAPGSRDKAHESIASSQPSAHANSDSPDRAGATHGPSGQDRAPAAPQPPPAHNPLPLKIFFLLVAIGLVTSTFTGLYMSWKFNQRNRWVLAVLFLAGIITPVTMVLI